MVRSTTSIFTAFGVALFMLLGCGGEASQEAGSASESQQAPGQSPSTQQQAPMPRQGPSSSFSPSDAQVEAAGRVYAELQSLQQELIEQQRQRQQQGDTTSQRKRRAQQQQKMMTAQKQALSEEANLTARQMQQIMRQAQQNPELRKKLFQAIEEAGGRVPQPPQSGQSQSGSN